MIRQLAAHDAGNSCGLRTFVVVAHPREGELLLPLDWIDHGAAEAVPAVGGREVVANAARTAPSACPPARAFAGSSCALAAPQRRQARFRSTLLTPPPSDLLPHCSSAIPSSPFDVLTAHLLEADRGNRRSARSASTSTPPATTDHDRRPFTHANGNARERTRLPATPVDPANLPKSPRPLTLTTQRAHSRAVLAPSRSARRGSSEFLRPLCTSLWPQT